MGHRELIAGVVVVAVVAACGGDEDSSDVGGTPSAPTGGWIGEAPGWESGTEGGADSLSDSASDTTSAAAEYAAPMDDTADRDEVAATTDATTATLFDPAGGAPLRAGSVDDNADFERYLAYLDRIADLRIPLRDYDPAGRVVATVTGANGLPVAGVEVAVRTGGAEVARLRTTADGSVRFHPAMHDAADATELELAVGDVTVPVAHGDTVTIEVPSDGGAEAPIPLDVLFLLDATGSMSDEIDRLKTSIDSVAERVAALEGTPDVRFAMTLYRDQGDAFVTATHDFTGDVAAFRAELAGVVADGGGDDPEALDEGLAEALGVPTWRDPASTVQLVFLVADAPPQIGRLVQQPYHRSIVDAATRGMKVFPVASSNSADQAEAVFRQIAQGTGARFVFLSYGAGGAATGTSTDISSIDYEELALDDLVVRLIAEELTALTGDGDIVPPPTPTTTTIPPEQ